MRVLQVLLQPLVEVYSIKVAIRVLLELVLL